MGRLDGKASGATCVDCRGQSEKYDRQGKKERNASGDRHGEREWEMFGIQ